MKSYSFVRYLCTGAAIGAIIYAIMVFMGIAEGVKQTQFWMPLAVGIAILFFQWLVHRKPK